MGWSSEFKTFVQRGNVMDMAVGVILGGAFGKIVTSLVNDVIMPPIGLAVGGVKFTDLAIRLGGTDEAPVNLAYGAFLQAAFDFLIIAFAVFWMVKVVNSLKKPEAPAPPKVAKASIGNITVSGARSLSEVQSKVSALRAPIRDCYQKHLAERPTEAGTLDMRFSIDSQGRVAGAGARNPMFTSNLVPCVNRTFYAMSFPPSDAGVVEVKLVVTLTSSP